MVVSSRMGAGTKTQVLRRAESVPRTEPSLYPSPYWYTVMQLFALSYTKFQCSYLCVHSLISLETINICPYAPVCVFIVLVCVVAV